MKNESKAFKVGKLQKEEKLCFHLIDVGFLILSPLLSLLLVLADIKQHCLVLIWVSWKNKKLERVCVCVCVTFIKWTHTKRTWKGVEFSARVSFPGLPTHLLKTAVPGTITFLSGRLHGYPHALLSGDPVGSSHPLQAAKNGLHRLRHRTPSQQPGPALCAAARAFLLAWPWAAEGRREAHSGRQRRGSSSRCAGTETWGGLDVGGFLRRSKAKMEKGGEVKWEREAGKDGCSKENRAGGWRKQPTSTNWHPVRTV